MDHHNIFMYSHLGNQFSFLFIYNLISGRFYWVLIDKCSARMWSFSDPKIFFRWQVIQQIDQ